jgi:alkylation response protein AidB-like acyl-CoA dehydrogenase
LNFEIADDLKALQLRTRRFIAEEVILDDLRVPATDVLGEVGQGLRAS